MSNTRYGLLLVVDGHTRVFTYSTNDFEITVWVVAFAFANLDRRMDRPPGSAVRSSEARQSGSSGGMRERRSLHSGRGTLALDPTPSCAAVPYTEPSAAQGFLVCTLGC